MFIHDPGGDMRYKDRMADVPASVCDSTQVLEQYRQLRHHWLV